MSNPTFSTALLFTPNHQSRIALLDGLVYLHAHCILHDGTMATFLPPLSHAKLLAYWQRGLDQVAQGSRHIVVQLMPVSSRTASAAEPVFEADGGVEAARSSAPVVEIDGVANEVAGVVSLWKPESETGPFRGEVEKLFTSPYHRRKGVARNVMRELEKAARQDGRWSLLLDTTVGTDAEQVYPRLGYMRVGVVNDYGYDPRTGGLKDEVWFWKDLRKAEEL